MSYLASRCGMSRASQRLWMWDPSRRSEGPNKANMPCSIWPQTCRETEGSVIDTGFTYLACYQTSSCALAKAILSSMECKISLTNCLLIPDEKWLVLPAINIFENYSLALNHPPNNLIWSLFSHDQSPKVHHLLRIFSKICFLTFLVVLNESSFGTYWKKWVNY